MLVCVCACACGLLCMFMPFYHCVCVRVFDYVCVRAVMCMCMHVYACVCVCSIMRTCMHSCAGALMRAF